MSSIFYHLTKLSRTRLVSSPLRWAGVVQFSILLTLMAVNTFPVYSQCYNLTSGGSIQFTGGSTTLSIAGNSYDPPTILNVTSPSGGSGRILQSSFE